MFASRPHAHYRWMAVALLFGVSATSAAQDAPAAAPAAQPAASDQAAQGPLTVERIPSGWVVTPDVSFTELNKEFGTLAGVYGGWLADRTWLVGAGAYWLANQSSDFKMAYGGLVLQYMAHSDRRIGFGVKGLVGGGQATLGASFKDIYGTPVDFEPTIRFGTHHPWGDGHRPPSPVVTPDTRLVFDELFFLAEPQAQLFWNVTNTVRLTIGAGYRVTSGGRELNDRIRGPVGSIGVEFGGGN
jgi:hypothetical protein